jgi:hypothetical protein
MRGFTHVGTCSDPGKNICILLSIKASLLFGKVSISEAQADGYSHLRATCSGCGRISDVPWKLLLRPPRITVDTFLGNIPLRCQKCGPREADGGIIEPCGP